jgi:hypothetical protein
MTLSRLDESCFVCGNCYWEAFSVSIPDNREGAFRMVKKSIILTGASLVLMLGWAALSFATDDFGGLTCPVIMKNYESVFYITGGIGLEERRALEKIGKKFSLKLVFAVTGGNYLGDVRVVIKNMAGEVILDAMSDGPWFFADPPQGRYNITVQAGGQAQSKVVQVSSRRQTMISFFWKE